MSCAFKFIVKEVWIVSCILFILIKKVNMVRTLVYIYTTDELLTLRHYNHERGYICIICLFLTTITKYFSREDGDLVLDRKCFIEIHF